MMQAGRSRQWAKALLPDALSHILFVGYSAVDSLSSKIKDSKKQKTITIDGKPTSNRCGITNLISFTSHIQYEDMIKYYSDINSEKIALVHGDYHRKCEFAKELQEELSKKIKTSKVVVVNKTTEILV
jgi:metallo-beta-lactamase family protein